MIPNTKDRSLATSEVTAGAEFSISIDDSAHIMNILRDTLYSDKVLAVLREYSSNAWDAHREAGKADVPIYVRIPTVENPEFVVRDFGKGLSLDGVLKVYTQYGKSTKRGTDDAVGMLGIGSKSGFAYSDSFTITSWHGGKKRIFNAVLDASEKGRINLLYEEDCPESETGVEIKIPAKVEDRYEFEKNARRLFQYFNPRPDINVQLPELPTTKKGLIAGAVFDGYVTDIHRGWNAVMGCIPYPIDTDQLEEFTVNGEKYQLPKFLERLNGVLYFNIGELQISASREALKYSDMTKQKLVDRFNELTEEFVKKAIAEIDAGGMTNWDKRLSALSVDSLDLPLPAIYKSLTTRKIEFTYREDDPDHIKTFRFTRATSRTHPYDIELGKTTRFVLRDPTKNRTVKGYDVQTWDYLVVPQEKHTIAEAKAELENFIVRNRLEGIPVVYLSSLNWSKTGPEKSINAKHSLSQFKYVHQQYATRPWSRHWDPVTRDPTDDDVFVIIQKFIPTHQHQLHFFRDVEKLKGWAEFFGLTFPEIYGYKTTDKERVVPSDCKGTHYPEWEKKFLRAMLDSPKAKEYMSVQEWSTAQDLNGTPLFGDNSTEESSLNGGMKKAKSAYGKWKSLLGENHEISQLLKKICEAKEVVQKLDSKVVRLVSKVRDQLEDRTKGEKKYYVHLTREQVKRLEKLREKYKPQPLSELKQALTSIYEKYPLLAAQRDLRVLWNGKDHNEWAQYITILDNIRAQAI